MSAHVFGGGASIQLGRVLGIRIGASPSWFVVLFLMIYLLSGYYDSFVVAVIGAGAFFGSLLAHELGHALAGRREGIGTTGIDLWFFGGFARLSREPRTPGEEFRVAAAGPAVTLVIVGLCLAAGALAGHGDDVVEPLLLQGQDADATGPLQVLGWLCLVNGALFVFNLVPAFPLDGGRITRAAVWARTGDRMRATRISAQMGRGFGFVLIGLGVAYLWTGDAASGIYIGVLGWFIAQAARGAVLSTAFSERLDGVTAGDLMDREPVTVPGDADALRTHEEFFLRYRWPWFFVVDAAGRYLGLLRSERVDEELEAGRPASPAGALADDEGGLRVPSDTPLQQLLAYEPLGRVGALAVVDADERLVGVLTVQQVRRAVAAGISSPLQP